jgi:hypothetical protein
MTKAEFSVGWMMLTAQPWGRWYRGDTAESAIQLELYYKHVSRANPKSWRSVCEQYAQGEKWPSLNDLKASLSNIGGYVQDGVKAIPVNRSSSGEQMPDKVREMLSKIGKGM